MLGCTNRCDAFVDAPLLRLPKTMLAVRKTSRFVLSVSAPPSADRYPRSPGPLPCSKSLISDHGKDRPSPREPGRKGPAANQNTVLAAHRARSPCHRSSESHTCPTFFPQNAQHQVVHSPSLARHSPGCTSIVTAMLERDLTASLGHPESHNVGLQGLFTAAGGVGSGPVTAVGNAQFQFASCTHAPKSEHGHIGGRPR